LPKGHNPAKTAVPPEASGDRKRVAVITADRSVLPDAQASLEGHFETVLLSDYAAILDFMTRTRTDALLIDIDTQGPDPHEGIRVIEELRRVAPDLVLIALTRSVARGVRKRALDAGAEMCFAAPINFEELRVVLARQLDRRGNQIEARRKQEHLHGRTSFCDMVGASEPMLRVYETIVQVANSRINVVIRGESGTGKELVARALVALSSRKDKPFISINCAALPESLIESELFGYERGAFTGATESRAGLIEAADGGTLFLDEIGTLSCTLQTKLLRVLEDRQIKRLGGRAAKRVDFRLLSATNEPLEHMIRAGRFREDLYYRIHVVPILLPPLRERPGDIELLARHFLRLHCANNEIRPKRLAPETLQVLSSYPWPGNVRELDNLVQRLVLMVADEVIKPAELPRPLQQISPWQETGAGLIPADGLDLDKELTRVEIEYLKAALERACGSKTTAAKLLHIDVQRMKYLCRKHGI
jgi:DNA-binding NtrC family response regulator